MSYLLNALTWSGRNTPLGRGKARRVLILAAKKLSGGRPVETTYRGVPIILHLDNTTERKALFSAYDRTEMEFLREYLSGPDAVYVDIGANSGLYVQWLAAHMREDAKVVAIEPNPQMCARIRQNVALLAKKPEIRIECCAAGDTASTMYLDLSHGFGTAALTDTGGLEVQVLPLRAILGNAGCDFISALKIDVEGYEDRILCGFFREAAHRAWPRAIVMEYVHSDRWNEDAIKLLKNWGYETIAKTRSNLLLRLRSMRPA
ncbi:MAG: FkbM family methyltransferase [Rhodomicrobium sp.]